METILNTIKKLLGIQQEYEYFDEDIMIHINTAFATLNQLGVGPAEGFYMDDKTALWDEPTGEKCPKCGNLLVFKGKDRTIKCSSCDYTK